MCVCVLIFVYIYIHVYVYICVCVYYMCVCMYKYICVCVYIRIYTVLYGIYQRTLTFATNKCKQIIRPHMYTYMDTKIDKHVYTYDKHPTNPAPGSGSKRATEHQQFWMKAGASSQKKWHELYDIYPVSDPICSTMVVKAAKKLNILLFPFRYMDGTSVKHLDSSLVIPLELSAQFSANSSAVGKPSTPAAWPKMEQMRKILVGRLP